MNDNYTAHQATAINYRMLLTMKERMRTQQAAMLVDMLAKQPSTQTQSPDEPTLVEDKERKKHIAEQMLQSLSTQTDMLGSELELAVTEADPDVRGRLRTILDSIERGEADLLEEYGLEAHYTWTNDVVASLISGHPIVNIHIPCIAPALSYHPVTGSLQFDSSKLSKRDIFCIELAALLRTIDPKMGHTRTIVQIDELAAGNPRRPLLEDERNQYILDIIDFFVTKKVLLPDDIPGENFIICRVSEQVHKSAGLIAQLASSREGTITTDTQGNTFFQPTKGLVETLALQSPASRREIQNSGILLQYADGSLSPQARGTIPFLDPTIAQGLHLIMLDKHLSSEQDKTYALARALGITHQEHYHNIFFDSELVSEDIILYWIGKLFQQHIQEFINLLSLYDEWHHFDSYEYAMRNYGLEIVPEDYQIISGVIAACKRLGIKPHTLEHIAEVGTGANLYSAMLVAPYLKHDAKLDILEFSPTNREYLRKTVTNTIQPDHARIWDKFEEFMIKTGGDTYKDTLAETKRKANIKFGDIFHLPTGKYDLVSSYFVAESIVDSLLPFNEAIKSLARAIKPDTGVLIVAHMLESEGYYAGIGTTFPAVNLTVSQLATAYRDADLDFVIVPVSGEEEKQPRDGYHGMAFVIAVPKRSGKKAQAALDAVAQLPGGKRPISSYEYSIEYCHIYTNEQVGTEHAASIEKLNEIVNNLDAKLASYNMCVMVDDYSFPKRNFDYAELLEWMENKGARPHFWINESQLIPVMEEVVGMIKNNDRKKKLESYIKKKKYPCSLFIATWYLSRLGKLKKTLPEITSTAERLINILPLRFAPFEAEAREIIASTPHASCLEYISNEYLEEDASNPIPPYNE